MFDFVQRRPRFLVVLLRVLCNPMSANTTKMLGASLWAQILAKILSLIPQNVDTTKHQNLAIDTTKFPDGEDATQCKSITPRRISHSVVCWIDDRYRGTSAHECLNYLV